MSNIYIIEKSIDTGYEICEFETIAIYRDNNKAIEHLNKLKEQKDDDDNYLKYYIIEAELID